jgi:uncharacterized protein YjbI with pentapeptide repeats
MIATPIKQKFLAHIDEDLQGKDYSCGNLTGCSFNRCNLSGARFSSTTLNGADFFGSNLSEADFRNADLVDAMLRESNLNDADLTCADIKRADFSKSSLLGTVIVGDKDGAIFDGCAINGATDLGAHLDQNSFKNAHIEYANLSNTEIYSTDFSGAYICELNASDACFDSAKFCTTTITSSNFTKVHISSADFEKADVAHTDFSEARLGSVNFTAARFEECNFDKAEFGCIQWFEIYRDENAIAHTRNRAEFKSCSFKQVDFANNFVMEFAENCDFTGADFSFVDASDRCFDGCTFDFAKLADANFSRAIMGEKVHRCNLNDVMFIDAMLDECEFDRSAGNDSNFSSAKAHKSSFKAVRLQSPIFRKADLREANFSEAILNNADFRGADLSGANFEYATLENCWIDEYTKLGKTALTKAQKNKLAFVPSVEGAKNPLEPKRKAKKQSVTINYHPKENGKILDRIEQVEVPIKYKKGALAITPDVSSVLKGKSKKPEGYVITLLDDKNKSVIRPSTNWLRSIKAGKECIAEILKIYPNFSSKWLFKLTKNEQRVIVSTVQLIMDKYRKYLI